jgi:replicative DNA helicase
VRAEQCLLGSILFDPTVIDKCAEVISPTDFCRESHREIFKAMLELAKFGRLAQSPEAPIDANALNSELTRLGIIEQVGGPSLARQQISTRTRRLAGLRSPPG